MMNILDLLKQDGHFIKHKGATHGGEYAGPCPFCGGSDRFVLWPYQKGGKGGGRFWCRGCGRNGDAIQYLRDTRDMSYFDACSYLNRTPDQPVTKNSTQDHTWKPRDAELPCELWRNKAGAFLKGAIETMWSDSGLSARGWLRDCKGLYDDTVKKASLGLNLQDTYRKRRSWGLDPLIDERSGKPRNIWLPEGIVIPCIQGSETVRLRIRRFKAERGGRYIIVSGSDMRTMSLGFDKPVVCIVESELDAILLYQEASDMADVAAIGSVNARPDKETDRRLREAEKILLCLDYDTKDGKVEIKFNWQFWMDRYPGKVKRWPTPIGKDPAEAYKDGVDLRAWVQAGL